MKDLEKKRKYREILIAQQADAAHRADLGRLYMNDKDLATSKGILAGLNPALF
jgi:hypothetical protein